MIRNSRKLKQARCVLQSEGLIEPDDKQDIHASKVLSKPVNDRSMIINEWALDWPIKQPETNHSSVLKNENYAQHGRAIQPFSSPAERMVGLGFRCWMRGLQTADTRFFDVCSRHYILSFGLKNGIILTSKLADWVYEIDRLRQRPIDIHRISDAGFSYDEVVAISMIAACQHSECPALQACVFAITHSFPADYHRPELNGKQAFSSDNSISKETDDELELPSLAAKDFADSLVDAGHILNQQSITYPLHAMANEATSYAH